jgi:hypothetical protein
LHDLLVSRPLRPTFHIYTDQRGKQVLKETNWFEMRHAASELPFPQTEEGITEVFWASEQEARELSLKTYGSLRELLDWYLGNVS